MRGETAVRIVLPKAVRARPVARRKEDPTSEGVLDAASRTCFERLRAYRADVARQRRVPAYVVALDRTLVELAQKRPRTLDELAGIHGMGPVRIEQFGLGFLSVVLGE